MINQTLADERESLLKNSLCFIQASIEELDNPTGVLYKYSLLHLWSGIFLLLKVRLYQEHWSLLFSNSDKASVEKFKSGNFLGVSFPQCQDRLLNIVSTDILSGHDKKILNNLRRKRNQVEHFFDHTISDEATKAYLYSGFDFTLSFIENINTEGFGDDVQDIISTIQEEAHQLEDFHNERMKHIAPDLKQHSRLLTCPECYNKTLVFPDEEDFALCKYCSHKVSRDDYGDIPECDEFRGVVRLKDVLSVNDIVCTECNAENNIVSNETGSDQPLHCLSCQQSFLELQTCSNCNTDYPITGRDDDPDGNHGPLERCPSCEHIEGTCFDTGNYD